VPFSSSSAYSLSQCHAKDAVAEVYSIPWVTLCALDVNKQACHPEVPGSPWEAEMLEDYNFL